jgi:hypothetical protein
VKTVLSWGAVVTGAAVLLLPGAAQSASAGPPPIVARSLYAVRPDPRLCPSPLCGGYWVALANHTRTRCADGLYQKTCYAAFAFSAATRQGLGTPIPSGALARAVLGTTTFDGRQLGALYVVELWAPVDTEAAAGHVFRVRDTGKPCVRAPCFSYRLGRVNTSTHTFLVSRVDLGPAENDPVTPRRAQVALRSEEGLLAAGRVTASTGGGRLFTATQVYLKAALPRA